MRFPLPAPLLEFLILAILDQQDSYGYEICQQIKTIQMIKEPVLYPILKKLQQEGLIESYEKIISNRRRKYYLLTVSGKKELEMMRRDWDTYAHGIARITNRKAENHE